MNALGVILTVVGLSIAKPMPSGDNWGYSSMAMNLNSGTSVCFAVQPKEGQMVISMDKQKSEITSFTDDKGGSLLLENKTMRNSYYQVRPDKKLLTFNITSKQLPTKGATSILVKGKIFVTVASGTKTVTTPSIPLSLKQPVECDGIKAFISQLALDGNGSSVQITFKSCQSFEIIQKIYLVTDNGTEIEGRFSGNGEYDNSYMMTYSFNIVDIPSSTKFKFVIFDKLENIEVPIDVKAVIGL